MSDLFQKITDTKGLLEKLVGGIPGFKGYIEKEARREADKLLRDTIATRYGAELDRLALLQRFSDMVKTAERGYSGFFDAVKVKETELAKLYAFDNALLDNAGKVTEAVNGLEAAVNNNEGIPAAVRKVSALVAECNTTFERRKEELLTA